MTLQRNLAAVKRLSGIGSRSLESNIEDMSLETASAARERQGQRNTGETSSLPSRKLIVAGLKRLVGAVVLLLPISVFAHQAHTNNGNMLLEREQTTVAKAVELRMGQPANVAEPKSNSTAITSSHSPNFLNQDSTLKTAKFFAPNATTLGIKEKSGELLGHPYGTISSQSSHVTGRPGAAQVQRLGGEDNNNPPTSARRESDEIVWTAWQHAEADHKQVCDNKSVIYSISPTETPFMTMAGRVNATAVLHEWQTDALAAAAGNKQVEGDDASGGTSVPTSRLGNYCQISSKYAVVTDTQQAVDKAGRASEMSYQVAKRLGELKRDMEYALTRNQGSSAGSASTARSTASVESWLTNPTGASMVGNSTSIGSGGNYTTPGWTSGGSILAPTDASVPGTFVVANLKAVIKACWTAGGQPGVIMCGPSTKQTISGFAGIATLYREAGTTAKGTAIVGAADKQKAANDSVWAVAA